MDLLGVWLTAVALAGLVSLLVRRSDARRPDYVETPLSDAEMAQVAKLARETVQDFLDALSHPDGSMEHFAVRVPAVYKETTEHLWLVQPAYDGHSFTGVLSADARVVPGYRKGRKIRIGRDHISDWMYVKEGRLVGGFSIRLHYRRQTKQMRRSLRASLPFEIDAEGA